VQYLGLALFAEGPTDYRFLPPVLRRTTEELCSMEGRTTVAISEEVLKLNLYLPQEYRDADLATKILEAAKTAKGAYNILFIHTDGAGNPEDAYNQRVQPAKERIAAEVSSQLERTVGVVPVREMEAWTLVDGDALRHAFGAVLDDKALGIPPRPVEVEGILDPKQTLNQAYANVVGAKRRRRTTAADFFEVIGERVQLSRLRQVPAFGRFEQELRTALVELNYLSERTP
jgi:hypothetical protein